MKYLLIMIFLLILGHYALSQKSSICDGDNIPFIAHEKPRFPGCEILELSNQEKEDCAQNLLLRYIENHLIYPDNAEMSRIEGTVILQFLVSRRGRLKEIEVVRSLNKECDQEAIRLIDNMNKMTLQWTPAKRFGKVVEIKYSLPVRFKL